MLKEFDPDMDAMIEKTDNVLKNEEIVKIAMAQAIVKNCQMIKLVFGTFCFLAIITITILEIVAELSKW
jgi:hypothetical protein